ncbi:MAG: VanZ family protein, partial [Planctomycetota bacterium]
LQLDYRGRPRTLLVQAYCALLLFCAAVPFSLSLDVAHLKRSVKQVNVVPFAEVASPTPALKTAGAGEADLYRQWLRFKQGSRWAAEALSFLILAWGLRKVFRREYRFPSVSAALLTLWIGCGMMLAVNVVHLLVVSRVCDVTDALFQGAGLLLGMAVPIRADGSHSPRTHGHDRRLQLRLSRFALIGVGGWIAFNGLLPLAFRFESGRWTQALRSHDLLPFFAYFHARMPVMLDDLAEKLVSFAVLGGVWAWGRSLAGERHPSAARAAWYGTLVATGIEIAQIYLPLRVPSLTDVILGGAGSAFGAVTWRHTRRLFRDIVKRPRRTGHKLPPPSTLSPFEELLASLAEPDENAPRESLPPVSSPRRRGTPPSDPIR